MNLPTLITVAIATPFAGLAVMLMFSKSAILFGRWPRVRAWVYTILGVVLTAGALWDVRVAGWSWTFGPISRLAMGAIWLGLGIWEFSHGEPVSLE